MQISSSVQAPSAAQSPAVQRAQDLTASARNIAFAGLYNDISKSEFREGANMAYEAASLIANEAGSSKVVDLLQRGSHAMATVADRDIAWTDAVVQAAEASKLLTIALDGFSAL